MMLRNKRGLSPLIAAVLLVAFTVAIAAFLATWSKSYTETQALAVEKETVAKLACGKAGLRIKACAFVKVPNENNYTVRLLARNAGSLKLGNLKVVIFYPDDTVKTLNFDPDLTLAPGDYKTIKTVDKVNDTAISLLYLETGDCLEVRDKTETCEVK
jgi:flagellin-like protein